jgi:hypothetical protein
MVLIIIRENPPKKYKQNSTMKAVVGEEKNREREYTHGMRACPNRNMIKAKYGKMSGEVKLGS